MIATGGGRSGMDVVFGSFAARSMVIACYQMDCVLSEGMDCMERRELPDAARD
jgi:hypothetical protein